jgi:hypothetical protein
MARISRDLAAACFGDVGAPRGLCPIGSGVYLPVQFVHAILKDGLVGLSRHAVHTDRRRSIQVVEAFDQHRRGDVVQQCREFAPAFRQFSTLPYRQTA